MYGQTVIGTCQKVSGSTCIAIKVGSGTFDFTAAKTGSITTAIDTASGVYKIGGLVLLI